MSKQSAFYQELQEMLLKPGCPLCHVGRKVSLSYLENLLWGSVNDPEVRTKLNEAMGFCSQHSRDLLQFTGERLGTTIIQQALLKEARRRLGRSRGPSSTPMLQRLQRSLKKARTVPVAQPALPPKGKCPVCQHGKRLEIRSLEVLLENLVGDLEGPLKTSGGLCWDHLDQALVACSDQASHTILIELHAQVWDQHIALMDEFIRKRDYRFSHEQITQEEGAAMYRAIAILTGEYPQM